MFRRTVEFDSLQNYDSFKGVIYTVASPVTRGGKPKACRSGWWRPAATTAGVETLLWARRLVGEWKIQVTGPMPPLEGRIGLGS